MGKIIDAHVHTGDWLGIKYEIEKLEAIMQNPLSNGDVIEKMIVSNLFSDIQDERKDEFEGNRELLDSVRSKPWFLPLAVCQPRKGSVDTIKRLFDENPGRFVGLKFHPDQQELIASDVKYEPYLKFAQENRLPCLFHCGIAWENHALVEESRRYSSPAAIYQMAKKFPSVPVVLAHLGAGGPLVHEKAILVLLESLEKKDANLYTDISWVDWETKEKVTIVALVRVLKERSALDRLLFGTDAPIGEFETLNEKGGWLLYSTVVADIKNAIKSDAKLASDSAGIIHKIFYLNAQKLFERGARGEQDFQPG